MEVQRAWFLDCQSGEQWGFVVYRTTAYAPSDKDTWEAFKQKLHSMIQERFDTASGPEEEISAARKSWTLRFEESSAMMDWSFGDVKRHYEKLLGSKTLPNSLSHPLCLVATSEAVRSVLEAPSPLPLPRSEYSAGGRSAPFLVAVDIYFDDCDEEEDDVNKYEGHFNVSVQCLLDGLFPLMAEQLCDVEELGRGVNNGKVWEF